MNDLQAAVEYFESLIQTIADDEWNRETRSSATAALTALREKQRMLDGTMPSCEICVAGEQAYSRGGDTAEINGNTLTVCAGAYFETISEFEINICPWCGRHLASDQAKEAGNDRQADEQHHKGTGDTNTAPRYPC